MTMRPFSSRLVALSMLLPVLMTACGDPDDVDTAAARDDEAAPTTPVPTADNCDLDVGLHTRADGLGIAISNPVLWVRLEAPGEARVEYDDSDPDLPERDRFLLHVPDDSVVASAEEIDISGGIRMSRELSEALHAEVSREDRSVYLAVKRSGKGRFFLTVSNDGSVRWFGSCMQERFEEVQPFFEAYEAGVAGSDPTGEDFALAIMDPERRDLLYDEYQEWAGLDDGPSLEELDPRYDWEALEPDERTAVPGMDRLPPEVEAAMRPGTIALDLPASWAGLDLTICSSNPMGFGPCVLTGQDVVYTGDIEPPPEDAPVRLPVFVYDEQPVKVWIGGTDDEPEDRILLAEVVAEVIPYADGGAQADLVATPAADTATNHEQIATEATRAPLFEVAG